jgi:hypothetical protein
MYPHERSLVKRMEQKPFALIGVNSDTDKVALKAVIAKEGNAWRSFWNGGSTDGRISRQWNVSSWPTIYVLDAKGTIRFKNVRGADLDEAVDKLMAESKPYLSEMAEAEDPHPFQKRAPAVTHCRRRSPCRPG